VGGWRITDRLAMTATATRPDREFLGDVKKTSRELFAYCRANDWAGYDPYDALNSRLFTSLPWLDSRLPRLVLTQALKRSPVNIRPLLRIPRTQNPKALALFAGALIKAPELAADPEAVVDSLLERLTALRSPGVAYWCWGYSFPWQTRTIVVPRWTPNLVCTTFVANALLDVYEQRGDRHCLSMAASAAEYIVKELYWASGESVAGFSYPLPSVRNQVHNANLLGAAFLCRAHRLTGDSRFLGPALKAARYSALRQRDDGSWVYGEAGSQQWIDNFHTGYNLCALRQIDNHLRTDEFEWRIRRGLEFYKKRFIRQDGAARYFHNSTYPIDIHCVAQSLITLMVLEGADRHSRGLAQSIFRWALDHMYDNRGFFYYRVLRLAVVRTSYMRWSQAWMLFALATVLKESGASAGSSPAPVSTTGASA
jgi:hypothetical protein